MADKERPVFTVAYKCANCNREWVEKYFRGDSIELVPAGVKLIDRRCAGEDAPGGCGYCKIIECPTCGNKKRIGVRQRKPILVPTEDIHGEEIKDDTQL